MCGQKCLAAEVIEEGKETLPPTKIIEVFASDLPEDAQIEIDFHWNIDRLDKYLVLVDCIEMHALYLSL